MPLVDDYPQMRLDCLKYKAKIVYEFDAADVPGRVMYPAMARAFRSGGAQIATQFQYDPLPLAAYNYGWQTHYLNLAYAPGKTLSFAIAAEAFRRTPRLQSFPPYPHNTEFGRFRLAYEEDLSEMITEDTFLYANDTQSCPAAPDRLKRIAGVGRSPVVNYDGTGAYFLDQLDEGVWRLEVYPDAVWVEDPFGPTSLQREVSRLVWKQHAMQIRLPNLGDDFSCRPLEADSAAGMVASEGRIVVEPAAYTLVRRDVTSAVVVESDFYAPRPNRQDVAVWWQVPDTWREGTPLPIQVTVAGADVTEVRLHLDGERVQTLGTETPYGYRGEIPAAVLTVGEHRLSLEVCCTGGRQWCPPAAGEPVTVLPAHAVWQFTPEQSLPQLQGSAAGQLVRPRLEVVGVHADSFKVPGSAVGFRVSAEAARQPGYDAIVVRARATQAATRRFELGLVQNDGRAYGTEVALYPQWGDLRIELNSLHPLWNTSSGQLDPTKLQQLSFLFGPWLDPDRATEPQGFEVQSVRFERQAPGRRLTVVPRDAPLPLFSVDRRDVRVQGQADRVVTLVPGSQPACQAIRITTAGFGSAPACLSFRKAVSEVAKAWQDRLAECNTVMITARGCTVDTNRLELVLLEEDSAPWGTEVALTPQWQEIAIPLDKLRFFWHWPHPASRGGSDDRLLPQQIDAINICFGAWLYGDQADRSHGIEIESIVLEKR